MNNKKYNFIPNVPRIWKKEIKNILSKYPYLFYVYGSRARGDNNYYSDLDLCIFQSFKNWSEKKEILNKLNNLSIPITFNLISWYSISKNFQESIKNDLIPLFY